MIEITPQHYSMMMMIVIIILLWVFCKALEYSIKISSNHRYTSIFFVAILDVQFLAHENILGVLQQYVKWSNLCNEKKKIIMISSNFAKAILLTERNLENGGKN